MTPEELNQARIAEAMRRRQHTIITDRTVAEHLCDVFCENWTPPEPVDPDLLALRRWLKDCGRYSPRSVDAGELDNEAVGRAYLAGCTRGREGAKGLVEALKDAQHALVVSEGLRATDLSEVQIEHLIRSGKSRSQLEFSLDHRATLAKIDAALASAKRGG